LALNNRVFLNAVAPKCPRDLRFMLFADFPVFTRDPAHRLRMPLADPGFTADLCDGNTFFPTLYNERLLPIRTEGPRSENFDAFINSAPYQPGKSSRKTLTQSKSILRGHITCLVQSRPKLPSKMSRERAV